MTAANTQGVGHGSAEPHNKGTDRASMGVEKLIGPRVVAAGNATLAGGVKTVTFPQPLDAAAASYVVLATDCTALQAVAITAKTDNNAGVFASFALAGNNADVIAWAVIKI